MKSRSLMVRDMERICRLGQAQANMARVRAIKITVALPFIREVIKIKMGREGMTTKVSVMIMRVRSRAPPAKPESRPTKTPTTVPMAATIKPMARELWMASMSSQNTSWPWLVVPRGWAPLAPRPLS